MNLTWQNDWCKFVALLVEMLQRNATNQELREFFQFKRVCWKGVLSEKMIDDEMSSVDVKMPDNANVQRVLESMNVIMSNELVLSVTSESIGQWQKATLGSEICFEAHFPIAGYPFTPVDLKHLSSGRKVVLIRLLGGKINEN